MNRAEFELLADGIIPGRVGPQNVQFQLKANEQVFIGKPANPPSSAVEELLRSTAIACPEVAGLHVFQMATKAGGSHTVIGIDVGGPVSKNRQEQIVGGFSAAIRSELKSGQALDFIFLAGAFREQILRLGLAIFHRE